MQLTTAFLPLAIDHDIIGQEIVSAGLTCDTPIGQVLRVSPTYERRIRRQRPRARTPQSQIDCSHPATCPSYKTSSRPSYPLLSLFPSSPPPCSLRLSLLEQATEICLRNRRSQEAQNDGSRCGKLEQRSLPFYCFSPWSSVTQNIDPPSSASIVQHYRPKPKNNPSRENKGWLELASR